MWCIDDCKLNKNRINLQDLCSSGKTDTTIVTLNAEKDSRKYQLEYAPVGNEIVNPAIIICGITPGYDTWQSFLKKLRQSKPIEVATFESIYSNMKVNLFHYLNYAGLFNYLAAFNSYWASAKQKSTYEHYWEKLFKDKDASENCGIQLTQACNCAILRGRDSKQPSKAAINEICEREPKCLFNRFKKSESLRLIIFLGTTIGLQKYWGKSCYYKNGVKNICISHPSGTNRVFNNGDVFKPINSEDTPQLRNAKRLLENAKNIIKDMEK